VSRFSKYIFEGGIRAWVVLVGVVALMMTSVIILCILVVIVGSGDWRTGAE
jgi:hypothetical protein